MTMGKFLLVGQYPRYSIFYPWVPGILLGEPSLELLAYTLAVRGIMLGAPSSGIGPSSAAPLAPAKAQGSTSFTAR